MQKINHGRVALGGLLASAVLVVGEMALIGSLRARLLAARDAAKMPPVVMKPVLSLIELLLTGVFLIWLYVAMRPRFGAGPLTAVRSGTAAWFGLGLLGTLHMAND